jgi:hypothetical protein
MNLALRNIFVLTSQMIFMCQNILQHGAFGFIFPPKEGVLRIFIANLNSTAGNNAFYMVTVAFQLWLQLCVV